MVLFLQLKLQESSVLFIRQSYIKFLLVYICSEVGIKFEQHELCDVLDNDSYYFIGDLEDAQRS